MGGGHQCELVASWGAGSMPLTGNGTYDPSVWRLRLWPLRTSSSAIGIVFFDDLYLVFSQCD